jgi:restriction system protein
MPLSFTKGNILDAKTEALVNPVNTVGIMGKGLAALVKKRYPDTFTKYAAACNSGEVRVGRMFVTESVFPGEPRWIINFPTKEHWRNPTRLEWVVSGLRDLRRVIAEKGMRSIAIPALGCGNGGLDWPEVRQTIVAALAEIPGVDIIVFEHVSGRQLEAPELIGAPLADTSTHSPSSGLRPHGGYRQLRSFQAAEIIYDATVAFCNRFVDSRSRTRDQMVQAARSGRQNIAEGSRASATSSQTELRLVNVARASLEELLLDYEDFLRQNSFPMWDKDDPQALKVREVGKLHQTDAIGSESYAQWLNHVDKAIIANTLICLIHQANYLLDKQIAGLEKLFIKEGGYSERLHAARLVERQRQNQNNQSDPTGPSKNRVCPACGKTMVPRTAKKGPKTGSQFWGCSRYPECMATLPINGPEGP